MNVADHWQRVYERREQQAGYASGQRPTAQRDDRADQSGAEQGFDDASTQRE